MRLLKFSPPLGAGAHEVEVTFNVVMTPEWFSEQRQMLMIAIQTVYGAAPFAQAPLA